MRRGSYVFSAECGGISIYRSGIPYLACYRKTGVKKPDIVKRMARRAGVTPAEAADRLDRVVHEILLRLKHGQEANLPGLGNLKLGPGGAVRLEHEEKRR